MTPRAAARAAATTIIPRFAILALLLLAVAAVAVAGGGLLGAPDAGEASSHWTDYDDDNDGLIDITTLAQLDAIRHDLDGNGDPASGGATAYNTAFPDRNTSSGGRMGCPSGACTGYELRADLDFDTNGDGSVGAGDDYPNWTPIGDYSNPYTNNAVFNGNGHTISNLTINASNISVVGLFGSVGSNNHAGGTIENVGLLDVNITASYARTGGQAFMDVGGLAGFFRGTARTSYATGTITVSSVTGNLTTEAGGLIGFLGFVGAGTAYATRLDASWSDVNVSITSSSTAGTSGGSQDSAGGLVGVVSSTSSSPTTLTTSYARDVTLASTRAGSDVGGLIGRAAGPNATISTSHWDTTNQATSGGGSGVVGKTTTELKSPTDYGASAGDTFFGWNIDVDGENGNDDPWDFGSSSQYPALKYGGHNLVAQGRTVDYDVDDDGLIDIRNLAQFNAVRYDLDGNGAPANANAYNSAFPDRYRGVAGRMGCPSGTCTGYELMANLDFDTDGDGSTHTNGAGDDGDAHYNGGAGFLPIGGAFTATFRGNGFTIDNLFIKRSIGGTSYIGMFTQVSASGRIETLGLTNAYVGNSAAFTGILAGSSRGAIVGCYVTGKVVGNRGRIGAMLGGLDGFFGTPAGPGAITASYSTAEVQLTGGTGGRGLLVGTSYRGSISYSYATGRSHGSGSTGQGLISNNVNTGGQTTAITASYWDTTTTGVSGGLATTALQMPTDYGATSSDTFFGWNANVDGDADTGDSSGNDDPWDFGTASQYPVLKYGGHDLVAQGRSPVDYDADNDGLIDISTLAQLDAIRHDLDGDGAPAGDGAAYNEVFLARERSAAGRMGCPAGACTGYELTASLDFDTDGDNDGTHSGGTGDSGDAYYTTTTGEGGGWNPIGGHAAAVGSGFAGSDATANPFTATFEGNGLTIDNLYINLSTTADADGRNVGLFANIGRGAAVRNLGLVSPYVKNTRTGGGNLNYNGALAGISSGAVSRVYVDGGQVDGGQAASGGALDYAGCLLGRNTGTVTDSYATCAATATGGTRGQAGGLLGANGITYATDAAPASVGVVRRSYATGAVTADLGAGGLVGIVDGSAASTVSDSYATGAVSLAAGGVGIPRAGGLVGRVTFGKVINSRATGDVSTAGTVASGSDVGGLVGYLSSTGGAVRDSYATGNVSAVAASPQNRLGGLVGRVAGTEVTRSYATGTVTTAGAGGSNGNRLGGLVGELADATARIRASYATGAVSSSGGGIDYLGGLVGYISRHDSEIHASYATGAVSASGGGTNRLGGLVGYVATTTANTYPRISTSYATGAVSTTGGGSNTLRGLVGGVATATRRPAFTNVYWDSSALGTGQSNGGDFTGTASGQTTAALQNPTGYTGIYENWNIDLDGATGNDDPWSFGTTTLYPALKYGGMDLGVQGQPFDYDADNDGLIDITTLAQLDAVRHNLDGDGDPDPTSDPGATFRKAFLHQDRRAATRMGCPAGACTGYELMADLDFDENGDDRITAADADYWNGGAGWTPIGGVSHASFVAIANYTATFEGNGRSISNLYINRAIDNDAPYNLVGLFAGIDGSAGRIRGVDLLNPQVSITRTGTVSNERLTYVAALTGYIGPGARVDGSRVVGGAVTFTHGGGQQSRVYVGCLAGRAYGTGSVGDANRAVIIGSSASCAVTSSMPFNGGQGIAFDGVALDSNRAAVGGLVGASFSGLDIIASYAAGAVSCRGGGSQTCGGLAGNLLDPSTIVSSYATGNVVNEFAFAPFSDPSAVPNCASDWRQPYHAYTGGLVGNIEGGSITDSYATGRITSPLGNIVRPYVQVGGLVGRSVASNIESVGSITNSYWDSETTGQSRIGFGRCDQANNGISTQGASTTAVLQTPTNYGATSNDPYYQWNRDLDNADGDNDATTDADDPWDFGVAGEYPVLKYGRHTLAAQGRTVVDYDDDNDGLIDITTLAQLNAVRYDLDGDGDIAVANAPAYRVAFPNGDSSAAGRMGCPLTDHDSNTATPEQATCTGYELRANLNFDTDGDNTADAPYANWTPIPAYNSAFNGNGRTISNLNISGSGAGNAGLFAQLNGSGSIYSVGLLNPSVRNGGSVNGGTGALVGRNAGGSIYAVYARGGSVNSTQNDARTGGLVGWNGDSGTITASYATVTVSSGNGQYARVGGLVGLNFVTHPSNVGTINDSYAASSVSGVTGALRATQGCLTGHGPTGRNVFGTVNNSYYQPGSCQSGTGSNTSGGSNAGTSKTSLQLRAEAGYDGIYADWNRNLDGDADTGDDQGRDDPWDFRLGHFPVLKYGGFDVNAQRPLLAEAGAAAEAYSGQTVTLDGSGSRALGGGALNYMWAQIDDGDEGDPDVTLAGANTASPTFPAPTGLTSDRTLKFRLTVTAAGRSVYDEVVVTIIAVRPNQLLSLSLTDAEGDAVGLAPSFLSLRYDYQASVANQIASVTVTPRVLSGSTMTLNGQTVSSGAEVEVPLKYRGNEITIVVTPPEPEPDETMNGETADGETADETVEETPCSVENDGIKPCTYTVTVRRAVPPRLAFVPRSLTIEEGGMGTYTVELDTRILTGAVTIAIASDNPAVTVSPTEVTLKPLDMAPRTITVTAAADDDRDDENVVITHTANGAHYYDVIATVGVTVNDTTAPPPAPDPALSVSATALRLTEGGSATYTVALATRPADNVTVTIASDNADVTARPTALTFTTANWSTAQRVTVSAASDGDTANDTATLTHTASGGGYGDAPAVSVTVSVTDDDTAGLAINPTVLNLIENGISAYIVSLTAQPSANVTVSIASDNPDVTVRPTALTFTPTNWATPQAVLVITRADAGGGDELATLRMTAQGGGYAGQTGQVLASVDDTLAPLPAGSVTTGPDAPAGVSVYAPPGSAATATVSPPADDTPTVATGAGFGIGSAVAVSVSDAPDDGLEICLPVSDGLRAEVNSALILTLLRYAAGSWTELDGARDLGDRVCAAGVTGQAAYAAAYALRPGTVLDLAASVGDTPGTIALSWTPPAAGTSQVAVVVNVADDTDYCLDTLPGLDASSYACAGRTAGQTYVALLIVLLPDGGYTLANIVRFELPVPASQ